MVSLVEKIVPKHVEINTELHDVKDNLARFKILQMNNEIPLKDLKELLTEIFINILADDKITRMNILFSWKLFHPLPPTFTEELSDKMSCSQQPDNFSIYHQIVGLM